MVFRPDFFQLPAAAALLPGAPAQAAKAEITSKVAIAETIREVADNANVRAGRVNFVMAKASPQVFRKRIQQPLEERSARRVLHLTAPFNFSWRKN
jgi:hypothetical protein